MYFIPAGIFIKKYQDTVRLSGFGESLDIFNWKNMFTLNI